MIGLSLLFSNDENRRLYDKGLIRTTLVSVSFVHTLAFYHWIEFFTQRGVNTGFFYKFSLKGSWWWDTWVSPNFVFIVGVALFPIFLTLAWRSIPLDLEE